VCLEVLSFHFVGKVLSLSLTLIFVIQLHNSLPLSRSLVDQHDDGFFQKNIVFYLGVYENRASFGFVLDQHCTLNDRYSMIREKHLWSFGSFSLPLRLYQTASVKRSSQTGDFTDNGLSSQELLIFVLELEQGTNTVLSNFVALKAKFDGKKKTLFLYSK
jgi:hypothetical protein